jgi:hypothetical protein
MASVTSLACETIAPRPTPGKMKTLLACPTSLAPPPMSTGPNGLPLATSALPSVQRSTSAGVASHFDVGLDSGNTIGDLARAAMALIACSVKAPWVPLVPIRMVGATWRTTVSRSCRLRS